MVCSLQGCSYKMERIKKLVVYTPFKFSNNLNPLKIVTIGDQILSEHVFAAHKIRNPNFGQVDVFSKVSVNRSDKTVTFKPRGDIFFSNGTKIGLSEIAKSLKSSFSATSHSELKNELIDIVINEERAEVVVRLKRVPKNIEALLSIPDFYLFDAADMPLQTYQYDKYSGPYTVEKLTEDHVTLRRNKFYPRDLIANEIDSLEIKTLDFDKPSSFLSKKNDDPILAYFVGSHVDKDDIKEIESHDLDLSIYPNEWVYMLGFNNDKINLSDRTLIRDFIYLNREEIIKDTPFAQKSYSVSPINKPFGLKENDYTPGKLNDLIRLSQKISIGIRKKDVDHKFVKNFVSLISRVENLDIVLFENVADIYSIPDIYLGVQGISAGDPVHHLNFFLKYEPLFKSFVTTGELNDIASIQNDSDFISKIKEIELRILENVCLIPIAHFPGIVINSKKIKPDPKLIGDWGIRAWTFKEL